MCLYWGLELTFNNSFNFRHFFGFTWPIAKTAEVPSPDIYIELSDVSSLAERIVLSIGRSRTRLRFQLKSRNVQSVWNRSDVTCHPIYSPRLAAKISGFIDHVFRLDKQQCAMDRFLSK
jgi:hypothetical protein